MKNNGSLIKVKLIAFGILLTSANGLFNVSGRRTAVGDFDKINEIFDNAYLVLPGEFPISDRVGFLTLDMLVRNVKCFDIYVGDVAISHQRLNDQNTEVLLEVTHVSLRCEMDYQYTYGFFRGDGKLDLTATNGAGSTSLNFASADFNSEPPISSSSAGCVATIEITDLDFQGDFLSEVIEFAQGPVSDIIEEQLEGFACEELGALDTNSLDEDILGQIVEAMAPFQNELTEDEVNPLFLEQTLELPSDFVALDLQDQENPFNEFLNQTLGRLTDLLMEETDGNLAINDFLRSSLLEEDGSLTLSPTQLGLNDTIYESHNNVTELSATLKHIKVFGLDSFTKFNPFLVVGNYTLRNELSWQRLAVEFDISLGIKPSSLDDATLQDSTSQGITERISLDISIENIDVVASLLLVIEENAFASLMLGPLLRNDNLLPCFFAFLRSAQMSGLEVNSNLISTLEYNVQSEGASGIGRIAQEALDAVYSMYKGELQNSTTAIFQRGIRDSLNEAIDAFLLNATDGSCQDIETITEFVDFREVFNEETSTYSSLLPLAKDILNSLPVDFAQINDIFLRRLTEEQSSVGGSLFFGGSLLDQNSSVQIGGLDAQVVLQARDARIDNLNSIGSPLELLGVVPNDPFLLENKATLGVSDVPLRFSIEVLLSLMGDDGIQLSNDLAISLDVFSATLVLTTMLKVVKSRLNNFPIQDILEYNCWLATIPAPTLDLYGIRADGVDPTAELRELAASVAGLNMSITCIDCTSPRMPELTEILSTKEAQEDLVEAMNRLLDYISDSLGGNFLQVQIDQLLNDSARKCPHSPTYEQNANATEYETLPYTVPNNDTSESLLVTLLVTTVTLALAVVSLVFAIKLFVRRRHRKWLQGLPPNQVRRLAHEQHEEEKAEAKLNAATQSMFTSPHVPKLVRWGMPFVILGSIGFFLSGHLSLGGTVNIEADIAGQKLRVDKFFEFSMAQSTVDIWNAGGKELAILVLIFSGIWPYTKQLVTLVVWFLPPSRLSVSRRESILLWFDRLGKWSMIDIFVLVISIVAFRVSIVSPKVLFLPEDFYSVDLLVVPLWGLYANMIAQLVSQVSSHVIIHYHRRIVNEAKHGSKHGSDQVAKNSSSANSSKSQVKDGGDSIQDGNCSPRAGDSDNKIALHQYHFGRPHRGETEKLVVRPWVNKVLLLVFVCVVVCVAIGCSIPSFSVEILGIIGIAVESGQGFEDATIYHSVFTVVELLLEEAKFLGTVGQYIGIGTLSVLFISTVLLIPIVEALALLRQWFSHSTRQEKIKMAINIEILQAWQYAEVYVIALFLASWQLGPLSQFMINSYCESLEGTFGQLASFGFLKEEDSQCFSVKSSIDGGSWILLIGALLLTLVNVFITKASAHYSHDKLEEVKREKSAFLLLPGNNHDNDSEIDNSDIHPVPVLFTDTFRWMLVRE